MKTVGGKVKLFKSCVWSKLKNTIIKGSKVSKVRLLGTKQNGCAVELHQKCKEKAHQVHEKVEN